MADHLISDIHVFHCWNVCLKHNALGSDMHIVKHWEVQYELKVRKYIKETHIYTWYVWNLRNFLRQPEKVELFISICCNPSTLHAREDKAWTAGLNYDK